MLSAEERRQLDEIERLVTMHDPKFVARMRADHSDQRPTWVPVLVYVLLWTAVLLVGAIAGWLVGVAVAAAGGLVAALIAVRRHRRDRAGWPPLGPRPSGWGPERC
ncbi:MAG TPA: DUF3040 domain-containing protein [Pilimelia sp.]|nr:DUF3040 domain-containing protein [Pilimelia sp.]